MNVKKGWERRKKNIKFHSFYGRVNETMKNEALLPIEINIPKRFSSEGNSNILHREKMLSFYVWMKKKEKKKFPDLVWFTMNEKEDSNDRFKGKVITSNKWKHFALV